MLRTAIEYAGADRGLLVLPRGSEFVIQAEAKTCGESISVSLREEGRQLAACRVVGVHVHREVEAVAQRRDEDLGRPGPEQPGHVLDRQDVGARADDLIGEAQVVVQRVEVLVGVEQVACVAEGDLGDRGPGLEHRVDH